MENSDPYSIRIVGHVWAVYIIIKQFFVLPGHFMKAPIFFFARIIMKILMIYN